MAENREVRIIEEFLKKLFDINKITSPSPEEEEVIQLISAYVSDRFSSMKYILGLAIDFTLLAQGLSKEHQPLNAFRAGYSSEKIFKDFELITKRGGRTANTLSLRIGGKQMGIRKYEEAVVDLFHSLKRSDYPSAYVYNTGQWHKYQDLLALCFSLGEEGRLALVNSLISFGLTQLTENKFWTRPKLRPRVFEEVLRSYNRPAKGENGGLVLQGIALGYFAADRPHLSLAVDKVRTGSSRQQRFGDIDGYLGADLELTCEVKDIELTADNIHRECGGFFNSCTDFRIRGIVFCQEYTADAHSEVSGQNCIIFSIEEMGAQIGMWDWSKQNAALSGLIHYLSHVEQNPDATKRLLKFILEHDESHSSLAFLD